MSASEPLATSLPAALRVDPNTPALFWVTHSMPRRMNPPWVASDFHRSEGYYCRAAYKPISRCFPPRG